MTKLTGHDVSTVQQQGWSGTVNGALLKLIAAAGFEAFLTMDKSLPAQQQLSGLSFGIVLRRAQSNKLGALEPLGPQILRALATLKPGNIVVVSADAATPP